MGNYDFRKDIVLGEKGEDVVINDLISMGGVLINKNKDNKYDCIIKRKNKEVKYEIKTDVYVKPTRDTGNLFVEFECRGKKSGVSVTQADWFVTYFKNLNEIWYIKTEILTNLLEINDFHQTWFSGDDGSNTKGYLIKREIFKEHFIVRDAIKGVKI